MRVHLGLLCLLMLAAPAYAQTYRWVDQQGVIHYSDRVPPQYAKQRREVINERGQVIGVKKRELTEDERAEAQRREQAAAKARAETERRAQYDRSLTATYEDVSQLDAAYEDRLAIVDGKIHAAEKTRADVRATLARLNERAGDKAEPGLSKRIAQTEQRLKEQDNVLQHLANDREALEQRYRNDRQRYLTLTADD